MKRFGFLMLILGILVVPQLADLQAADDDKREQKDKEKEQKAEEIDVEKAVERIAGNAGKVGDRLKEKDVGPMTRDLQKDILKDIDALIRKAQQPPPPMSGDGSPPPMSSDPPPPMNGQGNGQDKSNDGKSGSQKQGMGEQGKLPPPKSNQGSSGGGGEGKKEGQKSGRRERKPRSPMGSEKGPMPHESGSEPGPNPMPMANKEGKKDGKSDPKEEGKDSGKDPRGFDPKDGFGKASPKRANDKFAELYKDVWGHLPDRMRQEMDLYYREQFMPRYSELLKKYYSSIAEQKKTGGTDK